MYFSVCLQIFVLSLYYMKHAFHIELLCDHPEWWRYDVFVMVAGYDREGGEGRFSNLIDKASGPCPTPRVIVLDTEPCALADIYIYVVPNSPASTDIVREHPPFPVTLRVTAGKRLIDEQTYYVNQFGGLSVVAHRVVV